MEEIGLEKWHLKANGMGGNRQTFKVACRDENLDRVLAALRSNTSILGEENFTALSAYNQGFFGQLLIF